MIPFARDILNSCNKGINKINLNFINKYIIRYFNGIRTSLIIYTTKFITNIVEILASVFE